MQEGTHCEDALPKSDQEKRLVVLHRNEKKKINRNKTYV